MSDNLNEFGGFDNQDNNQDDSQSRQQSSDGRGLRKQLEEALAVKTALETELKELREERVGRQRSELLEAAGVPKKAHKLYSGEATEEKVAEWVKEYADILGLDGQAGDTPDANEDPDAAAFRQFQAASNNAASNAVGSNTALDARARAEALIAEGKHAEADKVIQQMLKGFAG